VPGHSGDLLGGSLTPKPLDIFKTDYNLNDVSDYLFKRHYCLFDLKDEYKKELFLKKIKKELYNWLLPKKYLKYLYFKNSTNNIK